MNSVSTGCIKTRCSDIIAGSTERRGRSLEMSCKEQRSMAKTNTTNTQHWRDKTWWVSLQCRYCRVLLIAEVQRKKGEVVKYQWTGLDFFQAYLTCHIWELLATIITPPLEAPVWKMRAKKKSLCFEPSAVWVSRIKRLYSKVKVIFVRYSFFVFFLPGNTDTSICNALFLDNQQQYWGRCVCVCVLLI